MRRRPFPLRLGLCYFTALFEDYRYKGNQTLAKHPLGYFSYDQLCNCYWIVDERQLAGHQTRLAHARQAKLMSQLDWTDNLYARD